MPDHREEWPPTLKRYIERFGQDPRIPDAYDLKKFSQVQGEFYTQFLREAAAVIHDAGKRCAAGVSWRRNGLIARRLGSLHKCFFDWQAWANEGLVDELVIGGDAATGLDPEHILPHVQHHARRHRHARSAPPWPAQSMGRNPRLPTGRSHAALIAY